MASRPHAAALSSVGRELQTTGYWPQQAQWWALSLLPENASVGLITFGTHVHVHELGFDECKPHTALQP